MHVYDNESKKGHASQKGTDTQTDTVTAQNVIYYTYFSQTTLSVNLPSLDYFRTFRLVMFCFDIFMHHLIIVVKNSLHSLMLDMLSLCHL